MKRLWRALFIGVLVLFNIGVVRPQGADEAPPATNVLTWVEDGPSPAESSPSVAGQLGLMDAAGEFNSFLDVPAQTSRLRACGDEASSPDNSMFAFYVGLDRGTLYLMKGADAPAVVHDDVSALACVGGGSFQYSPDSSKFAYIAYENDAASSEFADGFIHITDANTLEDLYSGDGAVAFDVSADGVAYVRFGTNDRHEADMATIFWWDGNGQARPLRVPDLKPDENCHFTSASVAILPDDNLLAMTGQRCRTGDTRTSWQLHYVDVAGHSTNIVAHDFLPGAFAAFSRSNQITVLSDGENALFTLPDGITANTVSLMEVNLKDYSTSTLIDKQAVYPTLNQGSDAFPITSPDGRWLALVTTTPNNENTLRIFDLNNLAEAPISISAGSKNDIISDMTFSADSQRLVFIAGSESTGRNADNSLMAVDLATGSDYRIMLGRFARGLAVAPDGSEVVVQDAQIVEDERQPPYLNTIQVNVDTSDTTTLFEGADIVDGKVTNQRFAKPLSWR